MSEVAREQVETAVAIKVTPGRADRVAALEAGRGGEGAIFRRRIAKLPLAKDVEVDRDAYLVTPALPGRKGSYAEVKPLN